MSALSEAIVAEAREWIGTPYVHQSSVKGVGTDCLGLLRGIWRTLYGEEPEAVPPYSFDWSEPQGEERLWEAALRHLRVKDLGDAAEGDVLLFRMKSEGVAKHLGVASEVGGSPRFIHAYSRHAVLESALTHPWSRRLVARFSFPQEGF